jgi:hypothetical protein
VNWIAAGHFRPLRMEGPDMFFILEKYLFNRILKKNSHAAWFMNIDGIGHKGTKWEYIMIIFLHFFYNK